MKKITGILSLFLLVLAVHGTLPAPPAAAGQPKTITLSAAFQGWPPFIIKSDDAEGQEGILIDVIREICLAEGYEFRLVFYPDKRGQMLLQEGRVDVIPKAMEWVKDPSDYLWTDPVIDSMDVVASRKTNPVHYSSPEDLAGLNVGLTFGFLYPKLDPLIREGRFTAHRANNSHNLLRMLCHGHIDCAVVNPLVARWHLRNQADLNPDDFVFNDKPLDNAPCRFAFTAGERWKPFIARFNERLAAMKKDGRLKAIVARYQ